MSADTCCFEFNEKVSLEEAEMTLHLALFAVEGLFGQARVRLEASYHVDEPDHTITVNGSTEVGEAVVRVFTGLLLREFGDETFKVRRAEAPCAVAAEGKAA